MLGRVRLLEAGGDLGQARVPRDERRRPGRGGLGGDHPERLGEDRRNDADVRKWKQVHEVAVLERAREERPRRRRGLELGAVVAEADDHRAGVEAAQRLEQEVDALVADQLAEVDDRRLVAGQELGEALGVPLVREPLLGVPRVRGVAARLLDERAQSLVPRLGPELVDVHSRRHLVHVVDVTADVLEHLPDVGRADERRLRGGEALGAPARELGPAAHRVLELGAVRLHGVARAARTRHRPSHQHVVREDDVCRQQLS